MNYSVILQADGNMVAYLNVINQKGENVIRYDLPLWHTNSYTSAPKTKKYRTPKLENLYNLVKKYPNVYSISVSESKYELTNNGDVIITAHYVCKCNNYPYSDLWCKVWDSSKDSIDRIV